ncbi:MAG: TRAP transporter small permease [Lachnospiraceae bacterium]|nr:TRAP transporter small permease [Lachnospiraceae bacterium]MDD7076543.1 TRAP transporter small permease [Lachnospiraceae bacterium]MDY3730708.1 TRAP transporter small permease [Candidatus Choladocola sp.]
MKKLKYVLDNFERWIMMALFVALFFIVMAGIISRVVFNSPFTWTEEAARLVFIWLIFMGISYGTKYDKHINVTIVLDKMPKKVSVLFTIFWDIVALAIFVWIGFYGVQYIIYMSNSVTSVLRINQGITTSIVAISAILNVIRIIEKLITEHIPQFKEA